MFRVPPKFDYVSKGFREIKKQHH